MPDYLLATLRQMARSISHSQCTATVNDLAGERLAEHVFHPGGSTSSNYGGSEPGSSRRRSGGGASGGGDNGSASGGGGGGGGGGNVEVAGAAPVRAVPPAQQPTPRRGLLGGGA